MDQSALSVFRWIAFALLFGLSVYGIVINWMAFLANIHYRKKKIEKHVSFVPIIFPLLGTIALWVSPLAATKFSWILWIVDIGTLSIPLAIIRHAMCSRRIGG